MLENKYGTEWQQSFINTPGPLAAFHKVSHFLSAIPHQVTGIMVAREKMKGWT